MTTLTAKKVLGLTTVAWILIPIGIVINQIGNVIVFTLKLPIYLDTIGTIIVALLAGPWVAAITGILTNVVSTLIIDPTALPFGIVNALVGIAAGYLAIWGMFNKVWKVFISGVILTLVSSLSATPIDVFFFGGVTGSGTDFVRTALLASGQQFWAAMFSASLITDILDKVFSAFVAYVVVRNLPKRFLDRFGVNIAQKVKA